MRCSTSICRAVFRIASVIRIASAISRTYSILRVTSPFGGITPVNIVVSVNIIISVDSTIPFVVFIAASSLISFYRLVSVIFLNKAAAYLIVSTGVIASANGLCRSCASLS